MRIRSHSLFRFLSSLQLAVPILLSLSVILAVATVYESWYGMRGAYILVYGTLWFYGVLLLLAINVFCAALSRYPWKKHQTGFVVTHSGILIILFGSWMTMQFGVDGNLPVVEGQSDSSVILHRLELSLADPASGRAEVFPIQESATREKGEVLSVGIGEGKRVVIADFLPRARFNEEIVASYLPNVGKPALQVELFNDRFQLQEWMEVGSASVEKRNLGPAELSFRSLESNADAKAFLAGDLDDTVLQIGKYGYVLLRYQGRSHKIDIENNLNRWKRVEATSVEVKLQRFLPHATVKAGELVNKSQVEKNPAVQLLVRDALGREEKHTLFANFPEFSTLHGGKTKKPEEIIPVKLRMISSALDPQRKKQMGRGRLQFAQTADGKKLLYRVLARSGTVNSKGEVEVGKSQPTGWMNLQFQVRNWYPYSVKKVVPQYVDRLEGTSETFSSAIQLKVLSDRVPASNMERWLFEGGVEDVEIKGMRHQLRYGKRRLTLPFDVKLDKFTIGSDPGSEKAASYESDVTVIDPDSSEPTSAHISMNEPLYYGGYTFYQASYQMRDGLPPISVFSVNYDPGRWVKYAGSIIMCLGIMLMFYMNPHYWNVLLGNRKERSTS